jgi:hypothetical protein
MAWPPHSHAGDRQVSDWGVVFYEHSRLAQIHPSVHGRKCCLHILEPRVGSAQSFGVQGVGFDCMQVCSRLQVCTMFGLSPWSSDCKLSIQAGRPVSV